MGRKIPDLSNVAMGDRPQISIKTRFPDRLKADGFAPCELEIFEET
jgi:hypothetical protein